MNADWSIFAEYYKIIIFDSIYLFNKKVNKNSNIYLIYLDNKHIYTYVI